MPDQSSAATEHAILAEITAPLEALPEDPVALVHADFPVGLRGYDRLAVDAYVQRTSQLVAEMQATRSPEAAVRRALERVGEQISGILQRAHETAEQITAQSRKEAEERLEQARAEGAEIAAVAAQRVRDLDADTDRIWIERHRIVDDARDLSAQLQALAEAAAQRFPDDGEGSAAFGAAQAATPPADADASAASVDTGDEEGTALMDDTSAETIVTEDDSEATQAFSPVDADEDPDSVAPTAAAPPERAPAGERSRSAIPPASQAANRRTRQ